MNADNNVRRDYRLGFSFQSSCTATAYIFGNTFDELIDNLALFNDAKAIQSFALHFSSALSNEQFSRLDSLVLETKNAEEIIAYAISRNFLTRIDDFEEVLISLENIPLMIKFSSKFQGNHLEEIRDFIIQHGTAVSMYHFSKIKGVQCTANLVALKNAILDTKDFFVIHDFLSFHAYNPEFIWENDIKKLVSLAIEDESGWYLSLIALEPTIRKEIGGEELEKALIQKGNPYTMVAFAINAKKENIPVNMEAIKHAVYQSKDWEGISFFEKSFPEERRKRFFFF